MRKTFALIALLGMMLVWFSGRADATQHRADHPITICHYDGSDAHGGSGKYSVITVDTSSTKFQGHEGHVHDIIPPSSDDGTIAVASKNWDSDGQAIWGNQCKLPDTTTTTEAPTTTTSVVSSTTSTTAAPTTTTSSTLPETSTVPTSVVTTTTAAPTTTTTAPPTTTTVTVAPTSTVPTSASTSTTSSTAPATTVSSSSTPTTGATPTSASSSPSSPSGPGSTESLPFTGGWQSLLGIVGIILFACGTLLLVAGVGRQPRR